MLWIIFIIWILFAAILGILDARTDNAVFIFLFIMSVVIMFYIPFIIHTV